MSELQSFTVNLSSKFLMELPSIHDESIWKSEY